MYGCDITSFSSDTQNINNQGNQRGYGLSAQPYLKQPWEITQFFCPVTYLLLTFCQLENKNCLISSHACPFWTAFQAIKANYTIFKPFFHYVWLMELTLSLAKACSSFRPILGQELSSKKALNPSLFGWLMKQQSGQNGSWWYDGN